MHILEYPDARLSRRCRDSFVLPWADIELMMRLMRQHHGIGLAAPQVGINARLFVTGWGEVFCNPRILRAEGSMTVVEGCLSLPGREFEVQRAKHITMADGRKFSGTQAVVIQHELDHLDGVLIIDKAEREIMPALEATCQSV